DEVQQIYDLFHMHITSFSYLLGHGIKSVSPLSSTSSNSSRNEAYSSFNSGSISISGFVVRFEAVLGSSAFPSTSKFGSAVVNTAAVASVVNNVSYVSSVGLSTAIIPHSLRETYQFH